MNDSELTRELFPLDDGAGPATPRSEAELDAALHAALDVALAPAPTPASTPSPTSTSPVRGASVADTVAKVASVRGAAVLGVSAAGLVVLALVVLAGRVSGPSEPASSHSPTSAPSHAPSGPAQPVDLAASASAHDELPRELAPRSETASAPAPSADDERAPSPSPSPTPARGRPSTTSRERVLTGTPDDLLARANVLRGERRFEEASDVYRAIVGTAPTSRAAYVARLSAAALALEPLHEPARARALYAEAAALDGELDAQAEHGLARSLRALGDHVGEARVLRGLVATHPGSSLAALARQRLLELDAASPSAPTTETP